MARLNKAQRERLAQIDDQLQRLKSDYDKAYAAGEDYDDLELEMLVLEQERDELTSK